MMENNMIDTVMEAEENTIAIDLMNKLTGTTYKGATVYGTNTMEQILQGYAEDLGINPRDKKILFENKRTGVATTDLSETVEMMGLQMCDVLAMSDNARVAGDEEPMEIDLLNKVTGTTYKDAAVYGSNTLGQILQEYSGDLGINPHDNKILFENKRTGMATSDLNETVESIGLQARDVLAVSDNAGVAGEEEPMEIDLLNKVTGTTYKDAAVYGSNTLGQILQEYSGDLGINPHDNKILFENKRTGMATSDLNETVESIGLQAGDVLAVSDNAGVAGEEELMEIDLLNKVTGTTYKDAAVYGSNTLDQILQEYSGDLGINPHDNKILFENKRTGMATSDLNETVESLGLQTKDVLAVSDNAGVAGEDSTVQINLLDEVTGTT